MDIESLIAQSLQKGLESLFSVSENLDRIKLQATKPEFDGSFTFVCFPYSGRLKKRPEEVGELLGAYLVENVDEISAFNVVKGFLNLVISDVAWLAKIQDLVNDDLSIAPKSEKIMVEYSSPNTNKPLHLGHLRNNFLGYSLSSILKANGYDVTMANLINDRGIHICKSMVAYIKFGNGETPESSGLKGDHLAGKYYVSFDKAYKIEIAELVNQYKSENDLTKNIENLKTTLKSLESKPKGEKLTDEEKEFVKLIKDINTKAEKNAPIFLEAQAMLLKWENEDKEVRTLWEQMNGWVYEGFDATYKRIGVKFDKYYYESDTYLLGKDIVEEGVAKQVLFKKEDNSVWCDLTDMKMDEKLVLRGDGTSVYITQDMGTADLKYQDYKLDRSIYVVGNEQEYHFKVLKGILSKMGRSYADGIFHLSYGMVDLPSGKMKSREGTVVDADDLIRDMVETARQRTMELGKIDGFTEDEAQTLFLQLALGALKYYLLKVDPKKRMMFNPEESIDFQGDTGVFIQFTHARISALLRTGKEMDIDFINLADVKLDTLSEFEVKVIETLSEYKKKIADASEKYSPSVIAQYCYDLAKAFSRMYSELPIFKNVTPEEQIIRLAIASATAKTIKNGLSLLGIEAPERM
jgi:arginyl-tRNA synthetase